MSSPNNPRLDEVLERSASLYETYIEQFMVADTIEEKLSVHNWYWSAQYSLWLDSIPERTEKAA